MMDDNPDQKPTQPPPPPPSDPALIQDLFKRGIERDE